MVVSDKDYSPVPTDEDKRIGAMMHTAMRLFTTGMAQQAAIVIEQLECIQASSHNSGHVSAASAALRAIRHMTAINEDSQ